MALGTCLGDRPNIHYLFNILFLFSYELGSGPANMRSNTRIDDGFAHTITVTRLGRQGSLMIDDDSVNAVSGMSQGQLQMLNADGNLYLGMYHKNYYQIFQSDVHCLIHR